MSHPPLESSVSCYWGPFYYKVEFIVWPVHHVQERWVAPIDPGALLEMEKSAKHVATELSHVMDNLRNSLYAVSKKKLCML